MIDSLNRLPGGKNSDKGRLLNDLYLLNGLKGVPQEVLAAISGILVASDKWMRRHVCNYRELTAQADRDGAAKERERAAKLREIAATSKRKS